jgi:cation:H+ antiporter
MLLDLALIAVGVGILASAGDKLVDFASALAERAGLTPAVIGLSVVAAGTSSPELVVSVASAVRGSPDLALANVVGSNIANLTLILGLTACLAPVPVHSQLLRLDFPVAVLASVLTWVLCRDLRFDRAEGAVYVACLVAFVAYSILAARRLLDKAELRAEAERVPRAAHPLSRHGPAVLGGGLVASIAALSLGAEALIRGASGMALALGVTERVVGLTVVALGTSLPELVATAAAARKGQQEMAVANLVGSNIFNLFGILGVAAVISPLAVAPSAARVDCAVMVGAVLLLAPFFYAARGVSRTAGAALAGGYFVYAVSLAL